MDNTTFYFTADGQNYHCDIGNLDPNASYRVTISYDSDVYKRQIEGSVAPIPCLGSETNECPMSEQCFTLPFWSGLDLSLIHILKKKRLCLWPARSASHLTKRKNQPRATSARTRDVYKRQLWVWAWRDTS